MTLRVFVASVLASLLLSSYLPAAQASVRPGAACTKAGKISIANGKRYTCIKSKKKLVWNKGTPTTSTTPTPTTSTTPTPTTSTTATPSTGGSSGGAVATSSAKTCANGGANCAVGDIGPGGGVIFYLQTGTALGTWKYLEVAPSAWNGENEPVLPWCPALLSNLGTATTVGTGSANTQKIVSQCSDANADFSVAAKVASSYRGGGKSDWFLPSKDELKLLFENRSAVGKIFSAAQYWSSSQDTSVLSWSLDFNSGMFTADVNGIDRYVRPIRAF